ncbi:hypothetical protein A4G99_21830 [Haladaptatus sp. R4]|nr:hypothetical protein A4G99_21830 [Haladaptatus sp. R4]
MGTLLIAAAALGFVSQAYLLLKEIKSKSRLQNVTTGLIAIFCLGIIAVEKFSMDLIKPFLVLILLLIVILSVVGYWIPQLSETP